MPQGLSNGDPHSLPWVPRWVQSKAHIGAFGEAYPSLAYTCLGPAQGIALPTLSDYIHTYIHIYIYIYVQTKLQGGGWVKTLPKALWEARVGSFERPEATAGPRQGYDGP